MLSTFLTAIQARPSPPVTEVSKLMSSLSMTDDIEPIVKRRLQGANADHLSRAIYTMSLVETREYSVVVFMLPSGAVLPLHDHPNMTVLFRVLRGAVHLRSFDWLGAPPTALPVFDGLLRASDPVVTIRPEGGGVIHSIAGAGEEGAVFIDYITPPYYMSPNYADCTYYAEEAAPTEQQPLRVRLRRMNPPPEVRMECLE